MGISLLDCTLRDGGYINDWKFGAAAIKGTVHLLEQTGVEMIELGFLRDVDYNPDRSLFPNTDSFKSILDHKASGVTYVGMADVSSPVPYDAIRPNDGKTIDGIRVIFKKDRISEGYNLCAHAKAMGYDVYVNLVSTDAYSDRELIDAIELFNGLIPTGLTIVDTFGTIRRGQLQRMLGIADNNLAEGIRLCYHAHNNLQQALGNAEMMVELGLRRDLVIDACVFGMGRGAGNLNLELFAEYLNGQLGKRYHVEPMLEIMDEYLSSFYKERFWGYSLPLYLTASLGYHPNYGIYLAEKNTLPVRAFRELLASIPEEYKYVFNKEVAEDCYRRYFRDYVDDSAAVAELTKELAGKNVLIVAPGRSVRRHWDVVEREARREGTAVVAVNFCDTNLNPDYVFLCNMKRVRSVLAERQEDTKLIVTSNIAVEVPGDWVVNQSSYVGRKGEPYDNAGLMALWLLVRLGVRRVRVAGMDGYLDSYGANFYDASYEPGHLSVAEDRNRMMRLGIARIREELDVEFVTPTLYE